jgi:hypothetical protein
MMHKSEIENLANGFRAELIAESLKYRGSEALGAVGAFVTAIEGHRALYAKKIRTIRLDADAATLALANETEQTINALAQQEIQRARNVGRVELNPELSTDQQPPQSHATVEPIRESKRDVAPARLEIMAEESDPEKYAPPDRRERRSDMAEESDSEKYVPPDRREQQSDIERIMFLDPTAENLNGAVQFVATMPLEEVDRVISSALEGLRDMMPDEGARVSRGSHQLRRSEPRGSGDGVA